jgi:hypothetical protein
MIRLSLLAPLVTVLTLTALVPEADAGARRSRPVRTGQTTCWDTAGTVIDCAGTGVDGDLRRGEPRAYQDNGDGTIRDKRTALTWEKLSDDGSIHDWDNVYLWDEAFEKIDDLNTPPCFAGFCDWRVPNRFELESIVDLGTMDPAVSAPFNTGCAPGCTVLTCSCTFSGVHWSSSSAAGAGNIGWGVNFFVGSANRNYLKATESYFVRAVRGGS